MALTGKVPDGFAKTKKIFERGIFLQLKTPNKFNYNFTVTLF